MSFWACAQLEAHRERLALHCLGLAGFQTYLPRLRVKRLTRTKKASVSTPALFPGYCFVWIELQWHAARWSPGVIRLVLDGIQPAKVTLRHFWNSQAQLRSSRSETRAKITGRLFNAPATGQH